MMIRPGAKVVVQSTEAKAESDKAAAATEKQQANR